MKNLNQLVINYKQTKDKEILNQIFSLLNKTIHDKATYLFYRRKFKKNNKWFYLSELGTLTVGDIEDELKLLILKLIQKADTTKPFDKYLFGSIWNWGKSLSHLCGEISKPLSLELEETTVTEPNIEIYNLEGVDMNYNEKRIIELIKENPKQTQMQMAERLGVTQSRVSQIVKKLRKKIRKHIET
jgi:predicted DNA-binding protein (UPF0251 family)